MKTSRPAAAPNALAFARLFAFAVALALPAIPVAAATATASIDMTGAISADVYNAAANTVRSLTLAPGAHIVAVGWDVSLTAYSPSWLTEMAVSLGDSTGAVGIDLTPGYGDNVSGTRSYSSGGLVDLLALGRDFSLGANGVLKLQTFEDLNDLSGTDGLWNSGTVTVAYAVADVPEPAPALLLLAGLAAVGLRRPARFAGSLPTPRRRR